MFHLGEYRNELERIRQYARKNGISDTDIDQALQKSFCILEKRNKKCAVSFCIKIIVVVLFITLVCFVTFDQRFLAVMLLRNLQNSIYPGLKLLRKIAVPVIKQYPSLSEFYEEWCILENPYFYIQDMDCWPCSVVHFVPDLTGYQISRSFNPGIPYIKIQNFSEVHMENVQQLYWKNSVTFEKDAAKVYSNNLTYRNVRDIMESKMHLNPTENLNNHVAWRINRITPARILRELFPKPMDTPNWWEQSIERFIFFDESKSPPYSLPNPECSNVAITCATGARLIRLIASSECTSSCKSFTVLLSTGKTLWYNWWYWRPISLPTLNSTNISISYLTSYC
nr:uncharacterized protein LOC117609476 isoform X1 [Osmia lignaria]